MANRSGYVVKIELFVPVPLTNLSAASEAIEAIRKAKDDKDPSDLWALKDIEVSKFDATSVNKRAAEAE